MASVSSAPRCSHWSPSSFDRSRDTIVRTVVAVALAGLLVIGLLLRTSRPWLSTALMVAGAVAPAIVWYWNPAGYVYSVIIAVAAIASAPYRASDTSFALAPADGSAAVIVVRRPTTDSETRSVERVEIHSGDLNRPYREVGRVDAVCKAYSRSSKALEIADVNARLASNALQRGANAVINVRYRRGPSLLAWQELKASGVAVVGSEDGAASDS